jgi:hypothetical protein
MMKSLTVTGEIVTRETMKLKAIWPNNILIAQFAAQSASLFRCVAYHSR